MSTTIDERVVSMEFDNRQFEKNAHTTINTLDKLKQKLNFKGMSDSLSTVGDASKSTAKCMNELEVASYRAGWQWEDVKGKFFSTIEWRMAVQMVDTVTNAVKNLTNNILGIPSMKAGFSEYETQMGAIQTILANTESKGSTLDDVNSALDELNLYADKTIYNFTEMTKNIGTFTAAGVDLDTSVSAIKGIANLAAVSGSTSQQASTAMYQLSQALSSGTVKLMDWNSVVNAGMGGQVFQDALKETAKVHGVAIDEIIKNNGSFRESLQEGWLTSEILTDTLAKFTGDLSEEQLRSQGYTEQQIKDIMKLGQTANDAATKVKTFTQLVDTLKESSQSGWAQTSELLFGDFEEAKQLWTRVSDTLGTMIANTANNRNKLLSGALKSGWDQFIDNGIFDEKGYTDQFKQVAKKYGLSIDDMINNETNLWKKRAEEQGVSVDSLISKEQIFQNVLRQGFDDNLINSEMFVESLGNLVSAYDNASDAELEANKVTRQQVEDLKKLHEQYTNGELKIEEYIEKMNRLSGRELIIQSLVNVWEAMLKIAKPIGKAFREIFPATTSQKLYDMIVGFEKFTRKLKISDENADKLRRTFRGLFAAVDIILTVIKKLFKGIGKILGAFKGLGGGILSVTAGIGDFLFGLRDVVNSSTAIEDFGENVGNVFLKIREVFTNFFRSVKNRVDTSGFDGFLSFLKKLWSVVKTVFGKIAEIFASIGNALFSAFDGSGVNTIIDVLNAGLLLGIFNGIRKILGSVSDITEAFTDILDGVSESLQAFQSKLKAEALKSIAVSIAILAASILVLSLIDDTKLEKSLAAMTLLTGGLMASLGIMGKLKTISISALNMLSLSTSLLILGKALVQLGGLDNEAMIRGLIGMTGALGILAGILFLMNKFIIPRYSELTEITKKNKTIFRNKADNTIFGQMVKLSLTLYIVGGAMKLLATLGWEGMGVALISMLFALGIMTGVIWVFSQIPSSAFNSTTTGATQMLILSLMLWPLAIGLRALANIGWDNITVGLGAMAAALGMLLVVMGVMTIFEQIAGKANESGAKISVTLSNALTMALLAVALGMLGLSLALVAAIKWEGILKGLFAMTVTLGVLLGTIALLKKIDASGKKMNAMAASLLILAVSLQMLTIPLMMIGALSWGAVGKGLLGLIGIMGGLAATMLLLNKIDSGAGKMNAIAASLLILAVAIQMITPSLIMLGSLKLGTILKGLLAIAGVFGIIGIATTLLSGTIPAMLAFAGAIALMGAACMAAGVGLYLIVSAINSIVDGFATGLRNLCQAIIDCSDVIAEAAAALIVSLVVALRNLIAPLVDGILGIITDTLAVLATHLPSLVASIAELTIGVLRELGNYIPAFLEVIFEVLGKLFDGIAQGLGSIDPDSLLKVITAVGLVAVLMKVLAQCANPKQLLLAMAGVLAVGVIMAELAAVFWVYGKAAEKWPELAETINKGSAIAAAIGNFIGSLIGGLVGGFMGGASTGLPMIATSLSKFMKNLQPFIDSVMSLDGTLLRNMAILMGTLGLMTVGGVLSSVAGIFGTIGIAKFMYELSLFGTGIKDFANITKDVDSTKVKGVAEAGKALGEMASSIPTSGGLWQLLAGKHDMVGFAASLGAFGLGLTNFALNTLLVPVGRVEKVAAAGKTLAEMASTIPVTGGLWGLIRGDNSLTNFAVSLGVFGLGLTNFALNTLLVPLGRVEKVAAAGKTLAEMASTIPVTGGLWGLIRGDNSLTNFANGLGAFGLGLSSFIFNTKSVSLERVGVLAAAGKTLAEMAATIPVTGGLWGQIKGDNNLALFAASIGAFGLALSSFVFNTMFVSLDRVGVLAEAGKTLAEMASTIPVTGGLWGLIRGNNTLSSFSTGIMQFGLALSLFSLETMTVPVDRIGQIADAGKTLAEMAAAVPTKGGLWQLLLTGKTPLQSFSDGIGYFGDGIATFIDKVGDRVVNTSAVEAACVAGEKIAKMTSKLPEEGLFTSNRRNMKSFKDQIKYFAEGISTYIGILGTDKLNIESVKGAVKAGKKLAEMASQVPDAGLFNGAKRNMKSFKEQIKFFGEGISDFVEKVGNKDYGNALKAAEVGVVIVKYVSDGMKSEEANLIATFETIIDSLIATINKHNLYDEFYKAGTNAGQGFKDGINSKSNSIMSTVSSIAKKALEIFKATFRIASPSKELYEIGEFADMGLAKGFEENADQVYSATSGIANGTIKGLQRALTGVGKLVENDINTQPTITPVLDLSQATAGVNRLNGLFNLSPSVGVLSRLDGISSAMNIQNGGNDDVISAIEKLGNNMSNKPGDTYNINGITYDNGSELQAAIETIIRAARIERRV